MQDGSFTRKIETACERLKELERQAAGLPAGQREPICKVSCEISEILQAMSSPSGKSGDGGAASQRRRADEAIYASRHFLQVANRHSEMQPLLNEFVMEVKDLTGCSAVGFRLLGENGSIPYEAQEGFSEEFCQSESPLSIESDQCICINVIKGAVDPRRSFYTPGGSFYSNGTTRFLETVPERERGKTRNVCIAFGYESLAVIPIRQGTRILGSIHVADPRENQVPLDIVETLEGVAMQLGTAIQRVRVEEALRESEELQRTTLSNISDAVFLTDETGAFTFICGNAHVIFGYTDREVSELGNVAKLLGDKLFDPQELVTLGEIENIEREVTDKGGRDHTVLVNVKRVSIKEGKVLYTCRDITDRKRAEEQIRFQAQLLDGVRESIIATDLEGTVVYWGKGAEALYGYSAEEVTGKPVTFIVGKQEREEEMARIREVLETGSWRGQYPQKRKDGSSFWADTAISLVTDREGEPQGLIGIDRDISERKRALEELQWELSVNAALAKLYRPLISPSSSIKSMAQTVLAQARSLTRSAHGYVSSIDPVTKDAVAHTLTEMMQNQCAVAGDDRRITFPCGADGRYPGLWGHSLNTREGLIANSPETHPASEGLRKGHIPVRRFLSVPVLLGEELVGQIAVANKEEPYTERDLEAVGRLAESYALAIQRHRAEEELRRALEISQFRQKEIAALLEGARAVLRYREFKDSARIIFDKCKNLIGAPAGYVALVNTEWTENEVLFLESGGLPCSVDPSLPMPIRGLREEAYRTSGAVYDNDFSASIHTKYLPAGHVRLDSVLFAPLVIEGRPVGLLGLANKPGGFTEQDARTASAFGELAAVALHNSRTLEALEQSEERYRSVVESASDAVVTFDREGRIIHWNSAAETIFGHTAGEAVGQSLSLIVTEKFRSSLETEMDRLVETGRASVVGSTVEFPARRKDGGLFPLEFSLATWNTREGGFFTSIMRDITERKLAEKKLRGALAFQKQILSTAATAIFAVNPERRVTSVNEAFCSITGFREQDVVGKGCDVLESESCANGCRLFDSEPPQPFLKKECRIRAKNGRQLTIIRNAETVRDLSGKIAGGIESFVDVTSLVEAREAAEAASRAKSAFLANMSHELRTPLTAIIGFAHALLREACGPMTDEQKRSVEDIHESGKHLLSLISDLLDLAKVEVGKVELDRMLLDLRPEIDWSIHLVRKRADARGIRLETDVPDSLPLVSANQRATRQILLNLLTNAVKFTPRGGRVKISARPAGAVVAVEVADTGIGIAPDEMGKIFDPFERSSRRQSRGIDGVGLGLPLVRGLVAAMGGTITVESEVATGSRFTFTLPAAGPGGDTEPAETSPECPSQFTFSISAPPPDRPEEKPEDS